MTSLQMFINNPLTISQDTNLYGNHVYEPTSYDYTFVINTTSFAPNMSGIFNVATYTQNTLNNDNVNINLSIYNSTTFSNWNTDFNNKSFVQVEMGQSIVGFATLQPTVDQSIGDRLLEVVAHKLFGHGQSRSAINNDSEFYTHDAQVWDHLVNSVTLDGVAHDIFNQYVASGRYENEIEKTNGDNPASNDVNGHIVNFNFDGFSFDFPLYLTGNILTDTSLTNDEKNLIKNGPDVGGTRLINGEYNIPILIKFRH